MSVTNEIATFEQNIFLTHDDKAPKLENWPPETFLEGEELAATVGTEQSTILKTFYPL